MYSPIVIDCIVHQCLFNKILIMSNSSVCIIEREVPFNNYRVTFALFFNSLNYESFVLFGIYLK